MKIIKDNYKILKEALQRNEPIGEIANNAFRKMFALDYYRPKVKLSLDRPYNVLLNKIRDRDENIFSVDSNPNVSVTVILTDLTNDASFRKLFDASIEKQIKKPEAIIINEEAANGDSIPPKYLGQSNSDITIFLVNDVLSDHALLRITRMFELRQELDVITFDEDQIDNKGLRSNPKLKGAFNYFQLLSYNYIGNAFAVRTKRIKEYLDENVDKNSFHEFLLHLEKTHFEITRIQEILISKYAEPNRIHPKRIFEKRYFDTNTSVENGLHADNAKIIFPRQEIKVSIIIPFRDHPELLKQCVDSIFKYTRYPNYEIILADNGSKDSATIALVNEYSQKENVTHFPIDIPFNFSEINNKAVKVATGKFLLFLNNDTEVLHEGWMDEMVRLLFIAEVGVVGAKLVYEDDTIQHAGVTIGIGHFAGHLFKEMKDDDSIYGQRIQSIQEYSAVTGACMMTRRRLFHRLEGFDEMNLAVAYNDVDYCLKARAKGFKVVYTPYAKLKHYESKTRTHDMSKSERDRYTKEIEFIKKKWPGISTNDPYYHKYLSRKKQDNSVSFNTTMSI